MKTIKVTCNVLHQTGIMKNLIQNFSHTVVLLIRPEEKKKFFEYYKLHISFLLPGYFQPKGHLSVFRFTVLPQSDVYLASSHLPAPIIFSCVPLSSWVSLCILLLLLISFPMTRLTEEAVVLCFQLTPRRISEPWSALLGRLLLLSLSAALVSNLPCLLFKHSNIPRLFHGTVRPDS